MTHNLPLIISEATEIAREMQHNVLTTEHIFLALLYSKEGSEFLGKFGGNVNEMASITYAYLKRYIPSSRSLDNIPMHTPSLERIFGLMIGHVQAQGRKRQPEIGDFIAAVLEEQHCYSAKILNSQGIDRYSVLTYLTQEQEKDSQQRENGNGSNQRQESYLAQFAKNLTQAAIDGKIDPIIGRNEEILRISEILCRRKKNNPVLIGESGVGKSAIAEGLALEISQKRVPQALYDAQIFMLDLASMVSGSKYRGDFEKRLKGVLAELEKIPNSIVFIDEIHTIVGAGAANSSSLDASNLLKPALANGSLRCIGATTFNEFKQTFDKDKALLRRFCKVEVKEPSIEDCYKILEGLQPIYEKFHNVKYTHATLKACVDLSHRYITDRFLPDKAIDLLDESGAYFKINTKDSLPTIKPRDIELIISKSVHIPKTQVNRDESRVLKDLEKTLKKRIFSQNKAIEEVVRVIKKNKAGLGELNKPIGSFVFAGPSGVGKTELSIELAKALGIAFVKFDMSEYMESHSISRLIGAPAGYVGFEQGGLLVDSIRKNPYCVLLLDEIEKAHSDIYNVLLQVLDSASLTDNAGNRADFKNVIVIMTSNAGSKEGNTLGFNADNKGKSEGAIKHLFSPEFRSRLDGVVHFDALGVREYRLIAQKYLDDLNLQLKDKKITLLPDSKVLEYLATHSVDNTLGAREIRRLIDTQIKLPLSDEILFGKLKKGGKVAITLKNKALHLQVL
ncbi:AAA family ATPase [uncultured Helicobacter sp.]|uniref:AAA family ATPase n=1 Tax=uncultured Helicobacter sp. TaxID=175537 RepID=UPI001C39E6C5|nr:AAA family ATPase [Candidatus Helicobacter avicola]